MDYIMKLNTGKWSGVLSNWEDTKNNANDTLLKWNIHEKYKDTLKTEEYKRLTFTNLNNEVLKLNNDLENQNYAEIKTKIAASSQYSEFVFPYSGVIPNLKISSVPNYYTQVENLQGRMNARNFQNPNFGHPSLKVTQSFNCTEDLCQGVSFTKSIILEVRGTSRAASLTKITASELPPVWFFISPLKNPTYEDQLRSLCDVTYDYNKSSACVSTVRSLLIKYGLLKEPVKNELPLNFMIDLVNIIAKNYGIGAKGYDTSQSLPNSNSFYPEVNARIESPNNFPTSRVVIPEKSLPVVNIVPED